MQNFIGNSKLEESNFQVRNIAFVVFSRQGMTIMTSLQRPHSVFTAFQRRYSCSLASSCDDDVIFAPIFNFYQIKVQDFNRLALCSKFHKTSKVVQLHPAHGTCALSSSMSPEKNRLRPSPRTVGREPVVRPTVKVIETSEFQMEIELLPRVL